MSAILYLTIALQAAPGLGLEPLIGPPAANLVRNPTLEEEVPEGQMPAGWLEFASDGGQYLQRLGGPGAGGSANAWTVEGRGEYGGVVAARVRVEPARCYVGGGWAKVIGPGKAAIKIDYYHQDELLDSTMIGLCEAANDWQQFRIVDWRYIPPQTTHVGLVGILIGDGVGLFDDLFLNTTERPVERIGDNLLLNGHFEHGIGARPASFSLFNYPREEPHWAWADTAGRTGGKGLRLWGDTTYIIYAHDPVPVDRAAAYMLTGWVRARAGEACLKIDYLDADYKWLGQQLSRSAEANGEWQEIELAADFTDYPTARHLGVACFAVEPGTDADYDDLVLTGPRVQVTAPAAEMPAEEPAAETPATPAGGGTPTFRPR